MSMPTPRRGFDAIAHRYDDDERESRVLRHLRARSVGRLRGAFAPGDRLLELGSGTGAEAAGLVAERSCRVALLDSSGPFLEGAARKVSAVRPEGLLGAHLLPAGSVEELVAIYGASSFDGAYSSLGALNGEPSLDPVAGGLSALVRSGGALVLSLINRWCPVEVAWFALHGQWRDATRRWGRSVSSSVYPGGPRDFATWYYSRREVERAFSAAFRLVHVEALPLLWPPTYLDFLVQRHPRLFHALEPIELWAAKKPWLRELGDHVLLQFRRR